MLDASGAGLINIDGRDLQVRQTRGILPDRNYKLGRGGHQIWKGKETSLRLDYVFTWLCPPRDEACEVYHYKGTLDVNHRGQRRRFSVVGIGGS